MLLPEEREMICEELRMLQIISKAHKEKQKNVKFIDYDRQAIEIRNSISEARDEDLPGYISQLAQTGAISQVRNQINERLLDLSNPYFGHFYFISNGKKYHAFLGNTVFQIPSKNIMVLDWRSSPVSTLYYLYEEGEEFEEEIGDRLWTGKMYYKRSLLFEGGELKMLKTGSMTYFRKDEDWLRAEEKEQTLGGGQFSAIRPDSFGKSSNHTAPMNKLGETSNIASFLSRKQYEVLTRPPEGALLIRGVAGSGKTTVSIQRLLWLISNSQFGNRHLPIAVFVPNKALIRYIRRILDNLKIKHIKVADWDKQLKIFIENVFPQFASTEIKDNGDFSLMALKRHPGMLAFLKAKISEKENSWEKFANSIQTNFKINLEIFLELKGTTYLEKIYKLRKFCDTGKSFQKIDSLIVFAVTSKAKIYLKKEAPYANSVDNLLAIWEEWMSDAEAIRTAVRAKQTGEFQENNLQEALSHLSASFFGRRASERGTLTAEDISDEDNENDPDEDNFESSVSYLQIEDLSILLFLYVRMCGKINFKGKKVLYRHVLADEGQELSLFDLHLIFEICATPKSLTIAGDINQSSDIYLTTDSWDEFICELNIPLNQAPMLNTGYRSTGQIMRLGVDILRNIADVSKIKALKQGPLPVFHRHTGQGEQVEFLQATLKNLIYKEPKAYCAVLFRDLKEAKIYFDLMKKFDVPKVNFVSEDEYLFENGIEFTEIQNAKGLEFDYVILVNADSARFPDYPYNRRLLYLGVTRAIYQLWVSNYAEPSSILPKDFIEQK